MRFKELLEAGQQINQDYISDKFKEAKKKIQQALKSIPEFQQKRAGFRLQRYVRTIGVSITKVNKNPALKQALYNDVKLSLQRIPNLVFVFDDKKQKIELTL